MLNEITRSSYYVRIFKAVEIKSSMKKNVVLVGVLAIIILAGVLFIIFNKDSSSYSQDSLASYSQDSLASKNSKQIQKASEEDRFAAYSAELACFFFDFDLQGDTANLSDMIKKIFELNDKYGFTEEEVLELKDNPKYRTTEFQSKAARVILELCPEMLDGVTFHNDEE